MPTHEPPQQLLAAANSGNASAQADLAEWYFDRALVHHAEHWWEKAATQGHVESQFNIGRTRHLQKDTAALEWYRKAASSGHLGAQNNLANLLMQRGDARSLAEAVEWFRKGAIAGFASAQHNLSIALKELAGGNLTGEVVHWAEVAAENGHAGAQYNLGRWTYERGYFEEGRNWLRRAADGGSSAAAELLQTIRRRGDPPQIT